ncbi:MAG: lysophospholipid acyltransferase family protein [Dehalococcoidia bacterium]
MTSVPLGGSHSEVATSAEAQPHRWALSLWARSFRSLARPILLTRHLQHYCSPLTIEGLEHFDEVNGRSLIIANHTSHFDTIIVLSLLPQRIFRRTAVVAAADRFYRERLKSAWYSLKYNAAPIARGGGSAALAYPAWLLQRDWSLLIFPEGHRSRTGELLPFHAGPAILAVRQETPVLPIHIEGATDILPPGERVSRPAAVRIRIGAPLAFAAGDDIGQAKDRMETAMRDLAGQRELAGMSA